MKTLLAKELRFLRPYFWLVALLSVMSVSTEVFSGFPDALPFDPIKWLDDDYEGAVMGVLFITLLSAAGLLVNEAEHGTLAFLDGLPVSRTRLFAAKAGAGFCLIAATVLSIMGEELLFGLLSLTSVNGPFPWHFFAVESALLAAVGFYLFSAALVLSFLRRWLLLGVGLILWTMLWLHSKQVPYFGLIDPFELMRTGLDETGPHIAWRHLFVQLAAGTILLAVAWAGFCNLGRSLSQTAGIWRKILVWGGWVIGPVVWFAVVQIYTANDDLSPRQMRTLHPGGESDFGRLNTDRYEFIFREDQRRAAVKLSKIADESLIVVGRYFDSPRLYDRIVVDLASQVAKHNAGQAHWKKIALPLALNPTFEEQRQVLGHETTHVLIDLVSDGRATGNFRRTRWFHEGVASYVELQHFAAPEERTRHERSAALAHAWEPVSFSKLCDNKEWSRLRSEDLVYPLGQIWCGILVQNYGEDAPGRVSRVLGTPAVAAADTSEASWRAALQACGYDLERVNAGFDSALDELVIKYREWSDSIPRIRATLSVTPTEILLRPDWKGISPGKLVARVNPSQPEGNSASELTLDPDSKGVFHIPRSHCPGPSFWYALGWITSDMRIPAFETWKEGTLK